MKSYLLLVLCIFFWSSTVVLTKYLEGDIPPIEMSFIRWFGTCVVLLPIFFMHFRQIIEILKNHFILMLTYGILAISCYTTFLYIGLADTTATNTLLINSNIPMIIMVLSAIFLKKPITKKQLLGLIISTFGVLLIISHGDISIMFHLDFNKGDIWVLLSSIVFAVYSILLHYKPITINQFTFMATITFLGTFILGIFYFIFGYTYSSAITTFSNFPIPLLYMIIFPSLICNILWSKSIESLGANIPGLFNHLMPLFGMILSFAFLGETLSLSHILSFIFIGIGLYMVLK